MNNNEKKNSGSENMKISASDSSQEEAPETLEMNVDDDRQETTPIYTKPGSVIVRTNIPGQQFSTKPEQLVGSTVGEVKIIKVLGRGGMGVVYYGFHQTIQINVAVKIIYPHFASNQSALLRFYREARESARLNHPNIVRLFNVGQDNDIHYLILEYIDGPTLSYLVKQHGLLEEKYAINYILQSLNGLAYAHTQGIIHRDIKPDNLMVTSSGVVKITDFGLAKEVESETRLTQTGMSMGTPSYMPPEQWDNDNVDYRADLYALGVTFYQLLSGILPYTGKKPSELIGQVVLGQAIPLSEVKPDLDAELVAIVHNMFSSRKEKRYQSADKIIQDLNAYLAGETPPNLPRLRRPVGRQSKFQAAKKIVNMELQKELPKRVSQKSGRRRAFAQRDAVISTEKPSSGKKIALFFSVVLLVAIGVAIGILAANSGNVEVKKDSPVTTKTIEVKPEIKLDTEDEDLMKARNGWIKECEEYIQKHGRYGRYYREVLKLKSSRTTGQQ